MHKLSETLQKIVLSRACGRQHRFFLYFSGTRSLPVGMHANAGCEDYAACFIDNSTITPRNRMRTMKFIRQPRHEIGRIAPALSPLGISLRLLTLAALAFVATCGDRFGMAAEDAPVAATTLPAPAAKEMPVTLPPQASAFQAEDISIGEPISLSSAPPMTAPAEAGQTPTAAIRGPSPGPSPVASPVRGFSAPASALPASGDLHPQRLPAAGWESPWMTP